MGDPIASCKLADIANPGEGALLLPAQPRQYSFFPCISVALIRISSEHPCHVANCQYLAWPEVLLKDLRHCLNPGILGIITSHPFPFLPMAPEFYVHRRAAVS
jgi:hypothetical protein